jgi:Flp pilus assembly protein TadD
MKRLLAAIGSLVLAVTLTVQAAGPDDQYIAIYYLIQQGDAALTAGNNSEAGARYNDALTALQQLKRGNPTWQENVVNYRINYLAKRIAALGAVAAAQSPPPAAETVTNTPAPVTSNAETESQLAALQSQVQQSKADNAALQAKLREALAARPTAVDPAELARAEQRIQELAKENDLLKASLSDAKARTGSEANAKLLAQLRQELDDANQKLAAEVARTKNLIRQKGDLEDRLSRTITSPRDDSAQRLAQRRLDEAEAKLATQESLTALLAQDKAALTARLSALEAEAANAAALRAENALLRRQVAELKAAPPVATNITADLSRRLTAAEVRIAALQSERDILSLERSALESRVKQLMATQASANTRPADTQRVQDLEKQVRSLQEQLAAANRQLAARPTATTAAQADDLAAQLNALRARLDVYEAKPVPYSAEELALFRTGPSRLAAADRPSRTSTSIPKPPQGTTTLVAEAQRFFSRGDFSHAEQKYKEVLSKDQRNVYTLANLAAIQLEQGKLDEAEKNLKQALAVAPNDAYSLQTLGYLKFRQEKLDDALTALSKAAQMNPDSAEIQNYLGVTLSQKGQRAAAETALRKAVQLEPNYASAHNNLAVIYATQNPPLIELARWHYQKALAAGHPKNPDLEKLFQPTNAAPNP